MEAHINDPAEYAGVGLRPRDNAPLPPPSMNSAYHLPIRDSDVILFDHTSTSMVDGTPLQLIWRSATSNPRVRLVMRSPSHPNEEPSFFMLHDCCRINAVGGDLMRIFPAATVSAPVLWDEREGMQMFNEEVKWHTGHRPSLPAKAWEYFGEGRPVTGAAPK